MELQDPHSKKTAFSSHSGDRHWLETLRSLAFSVEQQRQIPPIVSIHSTVAPLCDYQIGLWLCSQATPDSPLYNEVMVRHIRGPLNVTVLEQSLNGLYRRHASLRTIFSNTDNLEARPIQRVLPFESVCLATCQVSGESKEDLYKQAVHIVSQAAQQPFDLQRTPSWRTLLVQLGLQEFLLFLATHHLVFDGISEGILFRDLAVFYEALLLGEEEPLLELPIQYLDFAHWQQKWLTQTVLSKQLIYWKQQLAGSPPLLELPCDYPRPLVRSSQGTRHHIVINSSTVEALQNLSQQSGATLFMILMAAFQALLYRYTGQEDILIGTPVTTRTRPELEGLIGCFVNLLVIRTNLTGNPSFLDLLERVRTVALEAYTHRDLPFEQLVQELKPQRDPHYTPIIQAMLVLHPTTIPVLKFGGLVLEDLKVHTDTSKFDLTLELGKTPNCLEGWFEYNTDLFKPSTIAHLADHFLILLESIVINPQLGISNLPLLRSAEQNRLLVKWNNTQSNYQKYDCIHKLFEAQVECNPHGTAVVFEDKCLTYRALNCRANQLAHYLQSIGVGPEVLVGIYIERSLEMIVALLGILKAGGAYVPFDPSYPKERIDFMLEETQVQVLLTQQSLVKDLCSHRVRLICLDMSWDTIGQQDQGTPSNATTPENLAYVMYTSGSTGKPKGVSIVHRGVVRLVKGINYAELTSETSILQLAPIAFDASTFEIWGALLNGSRLVVMPPQPPSLKTLGQAIQQHHVTTLWLTAGLFHLMVDECLDDLKPLKQLLTGGDVVSITHVKKFLNQHPNCQLINCYGPTENTTFTCCYRITDEAIKFSASVPIGRPISNTQVYILNNFLQPVPPGGRGELYIGGDGLARGYFKRPELTKEKFISNPFSKESGSYLYKTGDMARFYPDGNIEFLGRLDHQVKIRGFRVELGEIEALLSQHSSVKETVVVLRNNLHSDPYLVAYVVPKYGQIPSVYELQSYLQKKLPVFMLPDRFLLLENFPYLPNGKINRKGLPNSIIYEDREKELIEPRDKIETRLLEIWKKVLGTSKIGVRDNFFDLGGHSLLAIRLNSEVQKEFNKSFNLPTIYDRASTVEEMANIVRNEQFDLDIELTAVPLQSEGKKPILFCIPGGGGDSIVFKDLVKYLSPDQPIYGLQLVWSKIKKKSLIRLEEIASYHIKTIRSLQPEGPYFLLGSSGGGIIAFEIAQQLRAERIGFLGMIDTLGPPYFHCLEKTNLGLLTNIKRISLTLAIHLRKIKSLEFTDKILYTKNLFEFVFHRELMKKVQITKKAILSYDAKVYDKKVTLFRCEIQGEMTEKDTYLGWENIIKENLRVLNIPGYHSTALKEPFVQEIAKHLKQYLEEN